MLRAKSGLTGPIVILALAGGIGSFAGSAQGVVTYGNFSGPDVSYTNVTESPLELPGPTPPALFGAPVISGDTLKFTPTAFGTSASGGANEFEDGGLTTDIIPTKTPSFIDIYEGGSWVVGGGTAATTASESLLINQLFITSVNGISVNPIVVTPTITFTDTNNGSATVTTTGDTIKFTGTAGFSGGTWDANASFDVNAALSTAGYTGNVTGLELDLDNQLSSASETNSSSSINKKFFDITTTPTSSVPEPATVTGIALASLGLLSRRRRV